MSQNFFIINVINVSQLSSGTGGIYSGKMTFQQLLTIHRLTERKEATFDPFDGTPVNYEALEEEEFQRHLSPSKLNEIRKYLKTELQEGNTRAVFPSSVIISLDINENNDVTLKDEQVEEFYTPDLETCFLINSEHSNDLKKLYIPKKNRICLIVDGQHRFYGLKKYYDELSLPARQNLEKFEFITTILLAFDPYQVAEVFANINFHQKPVNRSLYYDIFGSSANDRNEIQLAHFLTLHLQNNIDSPLKDMIKLLGKGYGLFSQAFLVEKILMHFAKGGVWYELYISYNSGGNSFQILPEFIKSYFKSIEFNYSNCWPEKVDRDGNLVYSAFTYEYVLCKTTGMGALLRLIKDIYPMTVGLAGDELKQVLDTIFSRIPKAEAANLFSKRGQYGGGGSEGLQLRLYRELKYRLNV